MKLILGLGNPGKKYEQTWHNAGFLALEQIRQSQANAFMKFKCSEKFRAEICDGTYLEEKIILAKPTTYMNKSGLATKAIMAFYKIGLPDLWVIHDDIDLPLGQIRVSRNSSAGGHRGVQSIIDEIGTKNFIRFRLGIKKETPVKIPAEVFVLNKIDKESKVIFDAGVGEIIGAIEVALTQGVTEAMNDFN
jgi:PTH1 family peptidyl-tRNA hydrolase